jgi:hypothetical protein
VLEDRSEALWLNRIVVMEGAELGHRRSADSTRIPQLVGGDLTRETRHLLEDWLSEAGERSNWKASLSGPPTG